MTVPQIGDDHFRVANDVCRLALDQHLAEIEHDGRGVFAGLESPLRAGRYHSLVADPALPDQLERSAAAGGVVMAVRHRSLPAEGVQFHPESILTPQGRKILQNFLAPSA